MPPGQDPEVSELLFNMYCALSSWTFSPSSHRSLNKLQSPVDGPEQAVAFLSVFTGLKQPEMITTPYLARVL